MWTYNYNTNELYHHGVKGMKWGVRKAKREAKKIIKYNRKRSDMYSNESIRNAELYRSTGRQEYKKAYLENAKKAEKFLAVSKLMEKKASDLRNIRNDDDINSIIYEALTKADERFNANPYIDRYNKYYGNERRMLRRPSKWKVYSLR